MRVTQLPRTFLILASAFCMTLLGCGGGGETSPKGPELGEVQQYLDEHPEALIDEEVASEDDEGAAAEEE